MYSARKATLRMSASSMIFALHQVKLCHCTTHDLVGEVPVPWADTGQGLPDQTQHRVYLDELDMLHSEILT